MRSTRVELESPLQRRDYEKYWHLPADAIRVSINSTASYEESIATFADALSIISDRSHSTVFETFDLYTPILRWPILKDRKPVDVIKFEDVQSVIADFGGLTNVILAYKNAITATECREGEIGSILRGINACELVFTFWRRNVTMPLLFRTHSTSDDRFERIYLESLAEVNAAAFVSRDHVNLEFVTCDHSIFAAIQSFVEPYVA